VSKEDTCELLIELLEFYHNLCRNYICIEGPIAAIGSASTCIYIAAYSHNHWKCSKCMVVQCSVGFYRHRVQIYFLLLLGSKTWACIPLLR